MARWLREHDFDAVVQATAAADAPGTGLDVPSFAALLKAHIAAESAFDPRAYRFEPRLNDASRGLMQVLASTAQGLGYTGPIGDDTTRTGGLYDPATSIALGGKYIADNLRATSGNVPTAIAAYNEGLSRALADAPSGQFRNASYVTRVLGYYAYFLNATASGGGGGGGGVTATLAQLDTPTLTGLLTAVILGGWLWWRRRSHGRMVYADA